MKTVKFKRDLKFIRDNFCFVQSNNTLYAKFDDEWVMKQYFSIAELQLIFGGTKNFIIKFVHKMKLRPVSKSRMKIRLSFNETRLISRALAMRKEGVEFDQIIKNVYHHDY